MPDFDVYFQINILDTFIDIWRPYGSPLAFLDGFGHRFGSRLASISIVLHSFFEHRFCMLFVLIVHVFLGAWNHVFYCKYNSFVHFRLFWKSMEFRRFRHPVGIILGTVWHTFRYFFGMYFCIDFWVPFFRRPASHTPSLARYGSPEVRRSRPKSIPNRPIIWSKATSFRPWVHFKAPPTQSWRNLHTHCLILNRPTECTMIS